MGYSVLNEIFFGQVYDGDQQVFSFHDGFFVTKNRLLVLNMTAGPHSFSATYGNAPSKEDFLSVNLESGKRYFVRVQSEADDVPVLRIGNGRLELVTCDVARVEAQKAKPLSGRTVSASFAQNIDPMQLKPACP